MPNTLQLVSAPSVTAVLTILFGLMAQDLYEEVKEKLIPAVKDLKKGDPKDEGVFIGPLIAEKEAQRVESWVQDAVSKGGRPLPVLCPPLNTGRWRSHREDVPMCIACFGMRPGTWI
jgi:hypothetical protein